MNRMTMLPDLESHTDGNLVEPYNENIKVDYMGFRNYVKEKYNGDYSKMTQEENNLFIIINEQQRKTA